MATQHLGPEELLVGAKVEFDSALSVRELTAAIDAAEQRVRAAVPTATVLYIEPDIFDAARSGSRQRAAATSAAAATAATNKSPAP
jgi:hypothetical protein